MKKNFEIKINLYLLQKIFLIRVKSFLNKRFYFVDEYEQVLELGRIMLEKILGFKSDYLGLERLILLLRLIYENKKIYVYLFERRVYGEKYL